MPENLPSDQAIQQTKPAVPAKSPGGKLVPQDPADELAAQRKAAGASA